MKTKLNQSNAGKLYAVISQIRDLQKKETELKEQFKSILGEGSFAFGPFVITISDAERSSLDRESLEKILGAKIKKYERITRFKKLEIKKGE